MTNHSEAYAVSRLQSAIASVGSIEAFAAGHGLSVSTLQKVLYGQRRMSQTVAATIGLERITVYKIKGSAK